MTRRRIIVLVALLVVVGAGFWGYQVSPYPRHNRQAAASEAQVLGAVRAQSGVTVLDSDSGVGAVSYANGGAAGTSRS